jgi:hypothetical protein
MRIHHAITSTLLALTFIVAGAESTATAEKGTASNVAAGAQQKPARMKMGYRQRLVAGKVLDMKDVEVKGYGQQQSETHVLARIRTFKGATVIVDLGLRNQMPEPVKVGDQIVAFGTVGRLNRRPVIIADKMAEIRNIPGRREIYESYPVNYPSDKSGKSNEGKSPDRAR